MTILTIDPLAGFTRSANGRDLKFLSRKRNPREWVLAIARAVLWQIKGQWKFDQTKGIDYFTIFDSVPDRRFVQAELYRELSRHFRVRSISVTQEGDDLRVSFVADLGAGEVVGPLSVSFAEREADRSSIRLVSALAADEGQTIILYFDRALNRHLAPEIEAFEILGAPAVVESVRINGSHVYLTLSDSVIGSARLTYQPTSTPLESIARDRVGSFSVAFEGADGPPAISMSAAFVAPAASFSATVEHAPTWEGLGDLAALWDADDVDAVIAGGWESRVGAARRLTQQGLTSGESTTTNWLGSGKSLRNFGSRYYARAAGGEGDIALGTDSALSVGAVGVFPSSVSVGDVHTLFNDLAAPEPYALLLYRPGAGATVNLMCAHQAGSALILISDVSAWLGLPFSYAVRMAAGNWACRLWVDGAMRTGSNASANAPSAYNGLAVGSSSAGSNLWRASLARLGAWSKGLTNSELETAVSAGRAAYLYAF